MSTKEAKATVLSADTTTIKDKSFKLEDYALKVTVKKTNTLIRPGKVRRKGESSLLFLVITHSSLFYVDHFKRYLSWSFMICVLPTPILLISKLSFSAIINQSI